MPLTKLSAPHRLHPMALVDRDPWILSKVAGKKVLHAGATDSMLTAERAANEKLLHQKLREAECDVMGVDIDGTGIAFLRERYGIDDIVCGDLEALDTLFAPSSFEVVLAADVMEHLNNPGRFLDGAGRVLKPGGVLIVTVPNAFSLKKFIGVSLFRQERNHPDHVCFYSYMNLYELLNRFGFVIAEANGFLLHDNTRAINRIANIVARCAMRILRNNHIADEFAILARRS